MALPNSGGFLYATTDAEAATTAFSKQAADNQHSRFLEIKDTASGAATSAAQALTTANAAKATADAALEAAGEAGAATVVANGDGTYTIA